MLKTFFQRPDQVREPLYVVTPIFNPVRFRSRWKLYQDFAKMVEEAGAILYTVEIAMGEREFALADIMYSRHIQLRSKHEIWFKENAINVAVSRLPMDWKYVAWVDADTRFVRDDWANETIQRLQHYDIVQMWSQYQDLNTNMELIGTANGFVHNMRINVDRSINIGSINTGDININIDQVNIFKCCCHCKPCICPPCPPYGYGYMGKPGYPGAPGLSWACTRKAWDTFGGLLDTCILGAGDWYMAHGLFGLINDRLVDRRNHSNYRKSIFDWQERALHLRKNVGTVPGLALHYWHGPKAHRKYGTREQILIETGYDPEVDLRRDWQGLWQLQEKNIPLRDRCRAYFHERQEDAL